MEVKDMTVEQLEDRKAELANLLDAEDADLDAIEAEGGKVVAALVLVDRQEGGREAIESRGIPVFPMFTRATIFGDK